MKKLLSISNLGRGSLALLTVAVVVLGSISHIVWATPAQDPYRQTVPTRTPIVIVVTATPVPPTAVPPAPTSPGAEVTAIVTAVITVTVTVTPEGGPTETPLPTEEPTTVPTTVPPAAPTDTRVPLPSPVLMTSTPTAVPSDTGVGGAVTALFVAVGGLGALGLAGLLIFFLRRRRTEDDQVSLEEAEGWE